MTRNLTNADADLPLEITRQIDSLCDEFEASLKRQIDTPLENFVNRVDPRWRRSLLRELVLLAMDALRRSGMSDPGKRVLDGNPALRAELDSLMAENGDATTVDYRFWNGSNEKSSGLSIRCPHCRNAMDLIVDASLVEIQCKTCGDTFSLINDELETRDSAAITRLAHFELVERLGMGEFGTVWKARDTLLERTVAIKIPRREKLDPVSVEKFMREARAAAQLHHPGIIRTHEVGRQNDTLYIVNEYIPGVPLSTTISDHRLEIREAVLMVLGIAEALEHAHQAGVVHRDIKPSNILVGDEGQPHLMDFGLAKRRENEITITTDGAILGTPAYMSPEQARGEASRVDGRSDLYSLGVILFQLLTGELPFRGSTRMLLQKVINDESPAPRTLDSRIPRDLDTICLKCLEKEPARRYNTAGELAADLRRYLAGQPVLARRVGLAGRALRWSRRNPALATLLFATLLTLVSATVVSSYFAWQAAQNAAAMTDTLYDSLLQEIRLSRENRQEGYGQDVTRLIDRARHLDTPRVNPVELRRQMVLSMGDFVAYPPKIVSPPAEGVVTAIRLSGDGSQLATALRGSGKTRIALSDVDSGTERASFAIPGSNAPVVAMAIAPNEQAVVAAVESGSIHSWAEVDGKWQQSPALDLGMAPKGIVLSDDGRWAAGFVESKLVLWDVAAGEALTTLATLPEWSIQNGAFDRDGRKFIAGYTNEANDSVGWAFWDLESGKRLEEFEMPNLGGTYPNAIDLISTGDRMAIGFDEALLNYSLIDFQRTYYSGIDSTIAVEFSPARPILAVANIRGRITLWNSLTNRQLATLQLPTPAAGTIHIDFSGDGRRLVAANVDHIHIWDLSSADEKTVLIGHQGAIPCAAFSPDGSTLATGGKDACVRLWNARSGELIGSMTIDEKVQTLAFSPDGAMLAVGCMGRTGDALLQLFDVATMEPRLKSSPPMGEVLSLAWSETPEGLFLAACGEKPSSTIGKKPEGGVAIWKVSPGSEVKIEPQRDLRRETGCRALVYNRTTGLLAWAEGNRLRAWDDSTQRELSLDAPPMNQEWHGLALLPDGRSTIFISRAGVAEIWDLKANRKTATIGEPGTFGAPQIAVSPDGVWLAALTQLDAVSIWHLPTGENVFALRPEAGAIWSLAWAPSGDRLAVGQSDGGLAIWNLRRIREKLADSALAWAEGSGE